MRDPSVQKPYVAAEAAHAYAWAYEHLLFPTWQRVVRGRTIEDHLEGLQLSQWQTRERIDALQVRSLKRLLQHAGENVPYYRELFAKLHFDPRGVTSAKDLGALPILTRDIVRERFEDLVDPAHRATNIHKGTSGTTGVPMKIEYCNESEAWRQAVRLRAYQWGGYHIGLPTLHYWAQPSTVPSGMAAAKVALDRALRREVYVDAIPHDDASLRHTAALIRRIKPHIIIGYTQATALLGRFILDHELRDWKDIPVICGAEGVLPSDREAIERAFGPAFNTYGSRETMLIGAECEVHDGLHLSEENLVVEIAGEAGQATAHGESGDVVVTDLHNFGMPFIRYANGDVAAMSTESRCRCGRGLRKLHHIEGRRCDTLRTKSGAPLPGMVFIALLANKDAIVRQFQVRQTPSGKVTLKVVRGSDWSEPRFERIVSRLRAYLGGLPLVVQFVETIAPNASGKRRPIMIVHSEESAA